MSWYDDQASKRSTILFIRSGNTIPFANPSSSLIGFLSFEGMIAGIVPWRHDAQSR